MNLNENEIVDVPKLVGELDKIIKKVSIAARVSDTQPLQGPLGIISGTQYTDGKLTVAKAEVKPVSRNIESAFSLEALQDLKATYGEKMEEVLAFYFQDELVYKIDSDFITMINDRASTVKDISFAGADYDTNLWAVGQSISILVNKGLCDLPISDNRSPQGWAIVSSNVASLLAGTLNDTNNEGLNDGSPSYLGRIAGVDYFIDYTHPNNGDDNVIFGIKGNGITKGSTIFSPYKNELIHTVNNIDGEKKQILLDRTGMCINPLDDKYYDEGNGTSAFLGKMNIDLSDLAVFKA